MGAGGGRFRGSRPFCGAGVLATPGVPGGPAPGRLDVEGVLGSGSGGVAGVLKRSAKGTAFSVSTAAPDLFSWALGGIDCEAGFDDIGSASGFVAGCTDSDAALTSAPAPGAAGFAGKNSN